MDPITQNNPTAKSVSSSAVTTFLDKLKLNPSQALMCEQAPTFKASDRMAMEMDPPARPCLSHDRAEHIWVAVQIRVPFGVPFYTGAALYWGPK